MKKFTLITLVILGFATAASAALPLKQMNFILDAKVSESDNRSVVDIPMELRHEINDIEPWYQASKREIRFKLPKTWVDPPTRIFRQPENDMLRMVKVYQLNRRTAVVSLVLRRKIPFDEVKVAAKFLDDRLRINLGIGDPGVLASDTTPEESVDPPIDLDKIFGETQLEESYRELAGSEEKSVENIGATTSESAEALALSLGENVPDLRLSLVKTLGALAGVVGLIFLLAAVGRRFLKDSPIFPGGSKGQMVRLLSSTPIDAKKRIAVLDVAGEIIVVGVCENQINMLTKIQNPESIERINGRPMGKVELPDVLDRSKDNNIAIDRRNRETPPQNETGNVFHKEFNQRVSILQNAVGTESAPKTPQGRDYGALQAIREKMAGMKKL